MSTQGTAMLDICAGFICKSSMDLFEQHCWENYICLRIHQGSYYLKFIVMLVWLCRALQSAGAGSGSACVDIPWLYYTGWWWHVLKWPRWLTEWKPSNVGGASGLCPAALSSQDWNNYVCLVPALSVLSRLSGPWRKLQIHKFLVNE